MDTEMTMPAVPASLPDSIVKNDIPRSARSTRRLIVMTRIPEAGRVKTRLIPALGSEGAAKLHGQLLQRALTTVGQRAEVSNVAVEIRYTGAAGVPFPHADHPSVSIVRQQQGADLGERLLWAVKAAKAEGAQGIVIVGTDCPDLSPEILQLAWQGLTNAGVVFGPAEDGGYYLIGLHDAHERLFHGIDWGTEQVLAQSLARCRQAGLSVAILPRLNDVDLPEDLVTCRRIGCGLEQCLPQATAGLLSIIIPTLHEAHNLHRLVEPFLATTDCEVIVADGGSTDGTPELALELGCRVICGTPGRGRQMNAGAVMARGEVLLFLHADTQLPTSFREEINATLATGAIAGAFQFQIDGPGRLYRWIEWGTNLRSRRLQLPYGDQGLFLRASDFFRLNGFRNWPLMEDFEFARRLKREGSIAIAPSAAPTSARRWGNVGAVRNTLLNQMCIALYLCGASSESIARFYSRRN